ncbi:ribonuclease HII [Rhodovulum sp. P5]|uniref:ribonuclease HII n=1 Tax=Rhodovulum sp. P5 TaxID=1564506 RepID=UPI0009D9BA03|nr:ribonuclease HII [Rhodovulum sp. P5]
MQQLSPDFTFERQAFAQGMRVVVGVDEVGRGPLAGPVTAAAVRLDPDAIPPGLDDSKKLTAARRAELAEAIRAVAEVSVAHASVEEIDRLNILQASHLAMCRAIAGLSTRPDFALIDGNRLPRDLPCAGQTVVKGDARCLSIAAASIMAKVTRDALMVDLAQHFPGYGWDKNAGYPTRTHLQAIRDIGVSPYHRRSFKPVHNILYQEKSITP